MTALENEESTIKRLTDTESETKRSTRNRTTRKQTEREKNEKNDNDKIKSINDSIQESKIIQTDENDAMVILRERILSDLKIEIKNLIEKSMDTLKKKELAEEVIAKSDDKDIRIKLLEETLAKKDEVIFLLSKELSILNSQRLSYTEKSPWLPSKNIENLCNSNEDSSVDEIGNLMGHENIVKDIEEAERTKLNLERQLSNVRKVHKERYYKTHFHKIKDSSFNSLADNMEVKSDLYKKNESVSDNYHFKKATCNIKKKSKKIIKKSI